MIRSIMLSILLSVTLMSSSNCMKNGNNDLNDEINTEEYHSYYEQFCKMLTQNDMLMNLFSKLPSKQSLNNFIKDHFEELLLLTSIGLSIGVLLEMYNHHVKCTQSQQGEIEVWKAITQTYQALVQRQNGTCPANLS